MNKKTPLSKSTFFFANWHIRGAIIIIFICSGMFAIVSCTSTKCAKRRKFLHLHDVIRENKCSRWVNWMNNVHLLDEQHKNECLMRSAILTYCCLDVHGMLNSRRTASLCIHISNSLLDCYFSSTLWNNIMQIVIHRWSGGEYATHPGELHLFFFQMPLIQNSWHALSPHTISPFGCWREKHASLMRNTIYSYSEIAWENRVKSHFHFICI